MIFSRICLFFLSFSLFSFFLSFFKNLKFSVYEIFGLLQSRHFYSVNVVDDLLLIQSIKENVIKNEVQTHFTSKTFDYKTNAAFKYNALKNYFNALIVHFLMQCDIMSNCNQLWYIFRPEVSSTVIPVWTRLHTSLKTTKTPADSNTLRLQTFKRSSIEIFFYNAIIFKDLKVSEDLFLSLQCLTMLKQTYCTLKMKCCMLWTLVRALDGHPLIHISSSTLFHLSDLHTDPQSETSTTGFCCASHRRSETWERPTFCPSNPGISGSGTAVISESSDDNQSESSQMFANNYAKSKISMTSVFTK